VPYRGGKFIGERLERIGAGERGAGGGELIKAMGVDTGDGADHVFGTVGIVLETVQSGGGGSGEGHVGGAVGVIVTQSAEHRGDLANGALIAANSAADRAESR
jgi:hypothetical protein